MASGDRKLSRRVLLGAAGGTALLPTGAAPNEDARPAARAARPRIGCVSWCFHDFSPGTDPSDAIDVMGEIGFEGTDLILLSRDDLDRFWTGAKVDAVRRRLEKNRLEVAQFVLFQPVVEGLTSPDAAERARGVDYFEAGCRLGKKLGAPVINIVAPWPRELTRPGGGYLPRHYELPNARPGDRFHIEMAPGFDWERVWTNFIATTKACLERARAHGLRLSLEHHTHCVVPDAVSFLRLWDAVRDPLLGYNLDTGWTLLQREYPPLAIHKVGPRLMNLHVRDIDAYMRAFVHVGQGVMDFRAIAEALKAVRFQGYLSIEQDKYPGDMKATCRRYLAMMKEYLA